MLDETPLWKNFDNDGEENLNKEIPLPERMRPRTIDEFLGQPHLVHEGKPLRAFLESGKVPNCILYGPPGVGKTSLARIMASMTGRHFIEINAVTSNVASLRGVLAEALEKKALSGKATVLFVDEIYHFNKQQQNVLLPFVEKGDIVLVGSTTENPWFEVNKTLLSRMIVFELYPLGHEAIIDLLKKASEDMERGLGKYGIKLSPEALEVLARLSGGDARQALYRLEVAAIATAARGASVIEKEKLKELTGSSFKRYDRAQDEHYKVVSALIKSMRGSDPDAALYWLGRMIAGGENLRFLARRLLIFAAEDVGLADQNALTLAASAAYAIDMVGYPEARIILSELVIYLASAPKSNSVYLAINRVLSAIEKGDLMEVPKHLDPHGEGYKYPHDFPGHWVPQKYLPEQRRFYYPQDIGEEKVIAKRLSNFWRRFRESVDN
ncbi:MAG: replication-associated recombination protein A [Thermovirga sp.]|nr:replication-associated recombination protein A [Thermovirga sp.]